ncbi:hypothetical protein bthur0005_52340 [Bacillus thuringiensis serovar pakistani str. T13001]|nr:hypothetical protein bthur0005_52340 [Bacillus thuringiensis serovar pakistani str. T13001]
MAADQAGNLSVTKVVVKVVEEQKQDPPVEPPNEPEKPSSTEDTSKQAPMEQGGQV